ncbi:MAG: alginate lyase, partial [Proteobacteria bacterium]|nr:alginate lyase [Pseudomonadota bacterium]
GSPGPDGATLTWLNGDRFYTYRMLPPSGTQLILGESGANDPRFNLRREPMLIERVAGAKDATFVNLLEPHGAYDASAETTTGGNSKITALSRMRSDDADIVTIGLTKGRTVTLAIADSADPNAAHRATIGGRTVQWKGHFARFDSGAGQ